MRRIHVNAVVSQSGDQSILLQATKSRRADRLGEYGIETGSNLQMRSQWRPEFGHLHYFPAYRGPRDGGFNSAETGGSGDCPRRVPGSWMVREWQLAAVSDDLSIFG